MDDQDWPYEDPPNLGIFVTLDLLDGLSEPMTIEHDLDGDWVVAGRVPFSVDNARLVHLSWAVHTFPTMRAAVEDLPRGRVRHRRTPSDDWTEEDLPDDD